jgi:2-oxoglutarate dehydrogenase E2 component (dihydrolipoamide succinyltransferase)
MKIEIKAPALPESVPDGTIATWHKEIGESVSRDELLVDIETDKVVIEVVSPTDGILEEVVKVSGETIISDEVIGRLSEGPSGTVKDSNIKQAVEQKVANNPTIAEPLLSPAAKKLAEENKINPDSIVGSGKDGRVTKEDVLSYLSSERTSSNAEVKEN